MVNLPYCIYLETSAVNYLVDNFTIEELILIRKLIKETQNADFFISSVTITEILATKDDLRKEQLIYCIQNICNDNLLNSPSEFLINYIKTGMPKIEEKYKFYSNYELSKIWKDLCRNIDKTFVYNSYDLCQRIKFLQKEFTEVVEILFKENSYLQSTIQYAMEQQNKDKTLSEYEKMIIKTSWLLIFIILCCGIDLLENSLIESFWADLKIESIFNRLIFAINNLAILSERGPIVMMSRMFYCQKDKKINRGTIIDMLHSIYLVYCDTFLTNDKHFLLLKNSDEHINFNKIQLISENTFFKQLRNTINTFNK